MLVSAVGSTSSRTSLIGCRTHRRSFVPSIDGLNIQTHSFSAVINQELLHHHQFHQNLIINLLRRPSCKKLVNLNILRAFDADPALQAVMNNLIHRRLPKLFNTRKLNEKLSKTKSIQCLIRCGILREEDVVSGANINIDPNKRDRGMFRRMSNHSFTEFLSQKPTLQELVKANMVQDVMTWTYIPYNNGILYLNLVIVLKCV